MRKPVRSILIVLALMAATGCTIWSDFVAKLAPEPEARPARSSEPIASASGPTSTLARVYMKAGKKAEERGDTETAQRFFEKADRLTPGIERRTPDPLTASSARPAQAAQRSSGPASDELKKMSITASAGNLNIRASELVRLYEQPAVTPDEATSLHRHAISHDFFGQHDLAQKTYRKALLLDPENPSIRNNLALSLTQSGDYSDAVREMSHVTASAQATPQHRHTLEMLLQFAFHQDAEMKKRHAVRDNRHKTEKRPAQAALPGAPSPPTRPEELDRIAPSAGTPYINPRDNADKTKTPDRTKWVVGSDANWWATRQKTSNRPDVTAGN